MGKKKGNRGKGQQQKDKNVISLFEFNTNATVGHDTPAGADRNASALPSAPKAAEDWDAEGGRPEYNSRGYKERRVDAYADGVDDAEFDQRDWTRRGPVEGPDGGFGAGPERDWTGGRSGPLDADEMGGMDRDWGGMRRGPVEAEGGAGGRDVDFAGMRRGPVEAEGPGGVGRDVDFGGMRRGPVEAEGPGGPGRDVDFAVRRGPVEAEGPAGLGRDVDFGGARKGPVEAVFEERDAQDWTARKGPVDADGPGPGARDVDFAVRRGPVEAEGAPGGPGARGVDFGGARKGPVEAVSAQPEVDFGGMRRGAKLMPEEAPGQREVDFGGMRRGAKMVAEETAPAREVDFGGMRRGAKLMPEETKGTDAGPAAGKTWRRAAPASTEKVTGEIARMKVSDASKADAPAAPARDWGAARRGPMVARGPAGGEARREDAGSGLAAARKMPPAAAAKAAAAANVEFGTDPTGEWTTVRTGVDKRRAPRRAGAPVREAAAAAPVTAAAANDASA